MKINPIELKGNWTLGYALDKHKIKSITKGENEWGHMQYDTLRTEIGEAVFQLKYRKDYSKIEIIADCIIEFLESKEITGDFNAIIPAPASKFRTIQPVAAVAEKIGQKLECFVANEYLKKMSSEELKNMDDEDKNHLLEESIVRQKKFKNESNVLVLDDLFDSGATITTMCKKLREDPNVKKIYVITMTKTGG